MTEEKWHVEASTAEALELLQTVNVIVIKNKLEVQKITIGTESITLESRHDNTEQIKTTKQEFHFTQEEIQEGSNYEK